MLMQLIRKDLLVAKKYVIILIVFIVAVQILPMFMSSESTVSIANFIFGLIFGQLIFFTTLSQLEGKFPKATALLCTAPYTRSTFVKAKYVLLLLLFVFCYIVNTIIMLIIDPSALLSPIVVLTALLVDAIIFGFYIPLELKFGYTKIRFIYIAVILFVAFVPQFLLSLLQALTSITQSAAGEFIVNIISAIQATPAPVLCLILALVIVAVLYISFKKSFSIFNKKEL